MAVYRPLSRRLDRCDRVIQNESRDPDGGNVYYVTMQIMFLTCKFRNVERNLHCDIVHITTIWVSSLTLGCNGVFVIKAYGRLRLLLLGGSISQFFSFLQIHGFLITRHTEMTTHQLLLYLAK